jgi:hypothetical protein
MQRNCKRWKKVFWENRKDNSVRTFERNKTEFVSTSRDKLKRVLMIFKENEV